MRYRLAFAASFVLLLTLLAACTRASAEIPKPRAPAVVRDTVKADASDSTKFWVVYTVSPVAPTDNLGPADSLITTAGSNTSGLVPTQRHAWGPVAQRDSFQFAKVAPGGTAWSGFYCAQQKRRALLSSSTCKPFTALVASDQAPPPPTVTLQIWPRNNDVWPVPAGLTKAYAIGGQTYCFCAFVTTSSGAVTRDAKPAGHPCVPVCDSVGLALYNVRYSVRRIRPGAPVGLASR